MSPDDLNSASEASPTLILDEISSRLGYITCSQVVSVYFDKLIYTGIIFKVGRGAYNSRDYGK